MDIIKRAHAKINLTLRVLNKRPDGYHNISSVMLKTELADTLRILENDSGKISVGWNIAERVEGDNTAARAAELMSSKFGIKSGLHIEIDKKIPIASGLAGGSADAAAVLHGINELFKLGLNTKELMEMGLEIGADVPFCVMEGAALAEGTGEILTPLEVSEVFENVRAALVTPPVSVSTREIYESVRNYSGDCEKETAAVIKALKSGDVRALCDNLKNDMEEIVIKKHPVIADIKCKMLRDGALGTLMSGSGATVYGIFDVNSEKNARYDYLKILTYSNSTFHI